MNRYMVESYRDLEKIARQWKGKVCLFGAGQIGRTWGYDVICAAGFTIDFYCDNRIEGVKHVNGIPVIAPEQLYQYGDMVLVILVLTEKYQKEVSTQLENHGIKNMFYMDYYIQQKLVESIRLSGKNEVIAKYECIADDIAYIKRRFYYQLGYPLNEKKPCTLNEKIQWLKINDYKEIYTTYADKYEVRNYIRNKFGEQYLIPLLYVTENNEMINENTITEYPCIVKPNHSCGNWKILKTPKETDWEELRWECENWLKKNHYYVGRENQYKDITPRIIVEKLLQTKEGKLPNDYKLHFFNGECEFIYCSIDREGANYRKIYDINWQPLDFMWSGQGERKGQGQDIDRPITFKEMYRIGSEIAKDLRYVRVDFYEVEGKLYCGEITLRHGSGFDKFCPITYDRYYGDKLKL